MKFSQVKKQLGRVRSVAPWIVDFRGFLISMDGFFGGCSIASKIPMDDQNSLKFTFSMDFFETVFFRGFFHRDKICNPSHHPEYNCNMSASSIDGGAQWNAHPDFTDDSDYR